MSQQLITQQGLAGHFSPLSNKICHPAHLDNPDNPDNINAPLTSLDQLDNFNKNIFSPKRRIRLLIQKY